jgi:predicted RNA binding protein YcfA (HicA-like mRNA interferase family)
MELETDVRKVKKRLRKEGWKSLGGGRGPGSHELFTREDALISVPDGKRGQLPTGTASTIAKQAGWAGGQRAGNV